MNYSDRLKEAMVDAGYVGDGAIVKLAKDCNIKSQHLSRLLHGAIKEPTASLHSRLALNLGVHPLWLSDGVGPKFSDLTVDAKGNVTYSLKSKDDSLTLSVHEEILLNNYRAAPLGVRDGVFKTIDAVATSLLAQQQSAA
jgi:hypothetical protein